MSTRREFIQSIGVLAGSVLLGSPNRAFSMSNKNVWFMPDEGEPHKRTWMAFGAHKKIWGAKLLPEVQRNLALIARTIATFEPVSMLVRKEDYATARKLVGKEIDLIICPLDDLWIRDTGAVFVATKNGEKAGVDFNPLGSYSPPLAA